MNEFWTAVLQNLVASGIGAAAGAIFGVFFSQFYQKRRDKEQFGDWTVIVKRPGLEDVERLIPVERAKLVLDDDSALSVYLKGIASPYGWINCDLVTDGYKNGMLQRNNDRRMFIIDYSKNPKRDAGPSNKDIMNELQRLGGKLGATTIDEALADRGHDSEITAAEGLHRST